MISDALNVGFPIVGGLCILVVLIILFRYNWKLFASLFGGVLMLALLSYGVGRLVLVYFPDLVRH